MPLSCGPGTSAVFFTSISIVSLFNEDFPKRGEGTEHITGQAARKTTVCGALYFMEHGKSAGV